MQSKHLEDDPLPMIMILGLEALLQPQEREVSFQIRFEEIHLQEVEVALEVVNAVGLLQLKQENVVPIISMAELEPQSQTPIGFHVRVTDWQAQLLFDEETILVFV